MPFSGSWRYILPCWRRIYSGASELFILGRDVARQALCNSALFASDVPLTATGTASGLLTGVDSTASSGTRFLAHALSRFRCAGY